jgi:3-hydroxybutyryl-CoA dehydrogenase
MGSGIAQVFAQNGYHTILYDVSREMLHKAQSKITSDLVILVNKNKINTADKADILSRIRFTNDINDCKAKLIIEAIIEDASVKSALLNTLAAVNDEQTIITTNTSSLPVTAIAENISRPEQFAGMHFFNPAPLMKLVEVVRTKFTNQPTIDFITGIIKTLGKTPVVCKDAPGFIVNRVARPYYLEALHLVENGTGDYETIDTLMEASGFKMGPFKLMDLIGNDINYSVSCIVHEALGSPGRLKPSVIQEQKVKEGALGRKTGKGYYEYPGK